MSLDTSHAIAASGMTIGSLFAQQCRLDREVPALQQGDRIFTFAEVNDRVNRTARVLAAAGIGRGDRIAVVSENRHEYIEVELAAAKLGAIVACQNLRMADQELTYCINLIAPSLVVTSERFEPVCARVVSSDVPRLVLGPSHEAKLAAVSGSEPPDLAQPEDPYIILYTSGTTGYPKAAVISHRAMVARGIISSADGAIFPKRTFICWAPLFHISGTDFSLATLLHGGKVIVRDGFSAEALVEIVGREEIGYFQLMPGVIDIFLATLKASGVKPKPVKAVGSMADLVPRTTIAALTTTLQAPYRNTFGSTETGMPPAAKGLIPIGVIPERLSKTLSSYCLVRLVDADDVDVPDGEPGELLIRGPSLFSGYWGAPEVTAQDFRGGWFHMGDVFVRNPDATLDFVDRRKYIIKSGGENIYPAEIERLLLASPRIADAAVVRRSDARWGEVPVAFVVARDRELTAADVLSLCDGKIARYKMPKEIRFIDADKMPRSITGKVKRHDLEAIIRQDVPTAGT